MAACDQSLSIVFEDDHVLVVNKPGGLATQAPQPFDSLEARIRAYLQGATPLDRMPYLGIPHRLDRCASGAVVFAKRRKAAQRLSKQFERREVGKIYLALVSGHVTGAQGTWRDYLRKLPGIARGEVVASDHPEARLAVLRYVVRQHHASHCCLRVQLETGRMHQIRIQAASRGFPVLGDDTYGSDVSFGPAAETPRDRWIALHASELSFKHPRSGEVQRFVAPLPGCWPVGIRSEM